MNRTVNRTVNGTVPRLLVSIVLLAASTPAMENEPAKAPASTWPGWRGPTRDGIVTGSSWPESLEGEALRSVWSVPLGPSYSGPVVAADRVFVTETRKKIGVEIVIALDRRSGEKLWESGWKGAMSVPFFARSNGSWIRSTPAWDGTRLFVAGMRDVLTCLDGKTGEISWQADLMKRLGTPVPAFGFVCSPLLDAEHVYVQAGASFVKIDKNDGTVLWRALADGGGMYGSAFSSPVFSSIAGIPQLLVQTRTKLAGVNADDGKVIWSREVKAFRGMNILTPTVSGDRVFTSTYGGGSLVLELQKTDTAVATELAWKNAAQGYMSSPVFIDGHTYLHLRNKRITCFRMKDGKRTWTTTDRFGQYMSTVAQGDKILALDQRGILLLFRADPKTFTIVDQRQVSESPTWAHLAVCGDEVYVRALDRLTCYRWRAVAGRAAGGGGLSAGG